MTVTVTVAVCIASGPSLKKEDVSYTHGKARVYVINDGYKIAPWADDLYACDFDWWDHHKGVPEFAGNKWTINSAAAIKYRLNHLIGNPSLPFSYRDKTIALGFNSGFQTLNLAVLNGATKVILLGYDMKRGIQGEKHWFGNHPQHLDRTPDFKKWINKFDIAAPLIKAEVINCTTDSDLSCFPKANLRDIL